MKMPKKPTEIMQKTVSPRDLAKEKYLAYKEYIVNVLRTLATSVEDEYFEAVANCTVLSPSGDAYGSDNRYIDFGFDDKPCDIVEALNRLEFLRRYADGEFDIDDKYCEGMELLHIKE